MLVPIFIKCCFTPKQEISRDSSTNQSHPSPCRGEPRVAIVSRTYPIKDGDSRQIAWKEEIEPFSSAGNEAERWRGQEDSLNQLIRLPCCWGCCEALDCGCPRLSTLTSAALTRITSSISQAGICGLCRETAPPFGSTQYNNRVVIYYIILYYIVL